MNINEIFYCSRCMKKIESEGICPFCGYNPDTPSGRYVLEEGTLLQNGKYQLGAVLGSGGFGITYAAWDYALEQPVAVKEYFPKNISKRDVWESDLISAEEEDRKFYQIGLARFSREARILGTLQNIKSVVSVYDWFEENQTAYIVMEFVRGKTLEKYVHEEHISPQKLIAMMRDLIDSLAAIHKLGVLHRDISPDNLLVQEDGSIKLIDFGAAVVEERRSAGKDNTVVFNRKFAPVEQFDENGRQGPWTDVYALSATIYYLITGELPRESLTKRTKDSLGPLYSKDIHLKKYQKKALADGLIVMPEKRIQSMDIFRSVLYHLPMPEEVKRRRRFMIQTASAAAGASVLIALFMVNAFRGFPLAYNICFGLRSDGWHILGYYGNEENLIIPEKCFGIPVTEIEARAFGWNTLRSAVIPGTVVRIGTQAFSGNEMLESVIIGEGNKTIDEYAFSDCPRLHTVILPSSTMRLAASAFHGNNSRLTVWCEDESLPQMNMFGIGINTASLDDYDTRTQESGACITGYHGEASAYEAEGKLVVPDYIGTDMVTSFEGKETGHLFGISLTSLTLPDYLEVLPAGIVNNMDRLEELNFGSHIREIGDFSLSGCTIRNLVLPETVETIGKEAFRQSCLENIYLPDSVEHVGEWAFADCTELTSARLPRKAEEIPEGMFEGCSSLTEVVLPEKLKGIGLYAFARCHDLETVTLPESLQSIAPYAFSECTGLKLINIPAGIKEISETAFDGCPTNMVIAGFRETAAEAYSKRYGFPFLAVDQWDFMSYGFVTDSGGLIIQDNAKEEEYTQLPSVYPGKKNTIISSIADGKKMKSSHVLLPEYANVIQPQAFAGNSYLTEAASRDSLKKIGEMAFWKCENLEAFHFAAGLTAIGRLAFAENPRLSSICLPDSVKELGNGAFWKCENLTELSVPSSLTLLPDSCFGETGFTELTIPGNVVKCRTAFSGCRHLKRAVMEEGVRSLWGTFWGCQSLESVVIPSTVKEISRSTFHGCTSLKDIWIYSRDVNLYFTSLSVSCIDSAEIKDGKPAFRETLLEPEGEDTPSLFSDCPDVVIHGYKDSSAEAYARKHGLSFEALPYQ